MKYQRLGQTKYQVSKICLGALTIGPLQANMDIRQGAEVIRAALEAGINFIDTAEIYRTYPYIREALKGRQEECIIASKSYAYTKEDMIKSVEKARREMDRDRIEIFLLHEQESALTIKGHWEAMEYLLKAKAQGIIGAVGISTHAIAGVRAAGEIKEIDVIHPMMNKEGIGIIDGKIDEMLTAVKNASQAGKGIYGMKAIGGGNLIKQAKEALAWAFSLDYVHAVAIGMKSPAEVRVNTAWLDEIDPDTADLDDISLVPRTLHIDSWCQGCGNCLDACPQKAISLIRGKAVVDKEKCVLCGYCGASCPEFCIKII